MATEKGIRTARLPLDEHLKLATRRVLTIDHVFQILGLVSGGKEWKEAFLEVLPAKKGIVVVKEDQGVEVASKGDNDRDNVKEEGEGESVVEEQKDGQEQ